MEHEPEKNEQDEADRRAREMARRLLTTRREPRKSEKTKQANLKPIRPGVSKPGKRGQAGEAF